MNVDRAEPPEPAADASLVAEVAVDGARVPGAAGTLSYGIPERWRARIDTGQLVWVPLRRRLTLGVVIRVHDEPVPYTLKAIHAPVEPAFRLPESSLATARWLARETANGLYATLAPFLPPGVGHRAVEYLTLASGVEITEVEVTAAQRRLLVLLDERGEVSLDAARSALGSSLASVVPKLESRGLIERVARVTHRVPSPRLDRFVR